MTELSQISSLCAANSPTVARSAGRTDRTEGRNGGLEGGEERKGEISIGVTVHPGGGQLGDSDGRGVAQTYTVITSLQSLLFFAVLQNFYTAENLRVFADLCSKSAVCILYCSMWSYIHVHSETPQQHGTLDTHHCSG